MKLSIIVYLIICNIVIAQKDSLNENIKIMNTYRTYLIDNILDWDGEYLVPKQSFERKKQDQVLGKALLSDEGIKLLDKEKNEILQSRLGQMGEIMRTGTEQELDEFMEQYAIEYEELSLNKHYSKDEFKSVLTSIKNVKDSNLTWIQIEIHKGVPKSELIEFLCLLESFNVKYSSDNDDLWEKAITQKKD